VKRATVDLNEERDEEGGFLESLKGKFSFSLVNLPIKVSFVECSVLKNDLKDVLAFINKYN